MTDDYTKHQRASELLDIIDLVSGVQEIEIAELKGLCEAHGIRSEKFIELWVDLCDASYEIIDAAEEKLF